MKRIVEIVASIVLVITIVGVLIFGIVMAPKFINKDNSLVCITLNNRKQYIITKDYEVYTSDSYKPNYLFGLKDSSDVIYLGKIDVADYEKVLNELKENIDKEGNNDIIINHKGRIVASMNKNPYEIISKYIKKD